MVLGLRDAGLEQSFGTEVQRLCCALYFIGLHGSSQPGLCATMRIDPLSMNEGELLRISLCLVGRSGHSCGMDRYSVDALTQPLDTTSRLRPSASTHLELIAQTRKIGVEARTPRPSDGRELTVSK